MTERSSVLFNMMKKVERFCLEEEEEVDFNPRSVTDDLSQIICADLRRSRKFFLYHQQKLLCFFRTKTVFFINPDEIDYFEFVFSSKWNNKYLAKNGSRLEIFQKHACWSIFDNFMIIF